MPENYVTTRMPSPGLEHVAQVLVVCFTEFSQTRLVEASGLCFLQVCTLLWYRNRTGSLECDQCQDVGLVCKGFSLEWIPDVLVALRRALLRTRSYMLSGSVSSVTIGSRLQAGRFVLNRLRVGECSQACSREEADGVRYQLVSWSIAEVERNLE